MGKDLLAPSPTFITDMHTGIIPMSLILPCGHQGVWKCRLHPWEMAKCGMQQCGVLQLLETKYFLSR